MSQAQFDNMITKIMNEPALGFYQDLHGRQGMTSSCLDRMLLYPLQTLAFGVPYSAFVDYFQISLQFGMKLYGEFDTSIKALYMCEFLRVPNNFDLCNIEKLHYNMYMTWTGCWDHWIVLIKNVRIAQKHRQVHIRVKKTLLTCSQGNCRLSHVFWNLLYGYAETLNDITMFYLFPF